MSTIRIKGYVYAEEDRFGVYGEPGTFKVFVLPYQSDADSWGVLVGEIDIPYTLPEGLDIKAEAVRQRIAALEAEKAKAGQEYAEKVAEINRRLSELQAITMEATT